MRLTVALLSLILFPSVSMWQYFDFQILNLQKLGAGTLELKVTNETTVRNIFCISFQLDLNSGVAAGGGGRSAVAPAVTDSGVVADGYISGARVFRDADQDGAYDVGETFVLTDSNGEFEGLAGDPQSRSWQMETMGKRLILRLVLHSILFYRPLLDLR